MTHLTLTGIWPTQLEELLGQLDEDLRLGQLTVSLWRPDPNNCRKIKPEDDHRAWSDWIPSLERCLELPALQAVARWQICLKHVYWGNHIDIWPADSVNFWPYSPFEACPAFRRRVAAAGTELGLGSLDE